MNSSQINHINIKLSLIVFKRRESEEERLPYLVPQKTVKANFFRTEEYLTKDNRLDINQWLNCARETYFCYGYDYEFIGVTDIQICIEKTKPPIGSFTELPLVLRSITEAISKN